MNCEVVVTRTLTYEYRFRAEDAPPVIELQDMQVIDDSGPQIHVGDVQ